MQIQPVFTHHLQLSSQQVEHLLTFDLPSLLQEPLVQHQLQALNVPLLQATLPTAGEVLVDKLPPFYHWLKAELGVRRVPDSPDHTTRWVVNFLNNQESLTRLVDLHRPVPQPALEAAVPRLVCLFEPVSDQRVRHEWQRAIALLCLVLVVAGREAARQQLAS